MGKAGLLLAIRSNVYDLKRRFMSEPCGTAGAIPS
jgi:hypothetical protein